MKKILLTILAGLSCVVVIAAQLNPAQSKVKTDIYNALKNTCSNIVDEGETLRFQYNGNRYFININTLNSQVLYISLMLGFNLPEDYNIEIANIAALRAASGKPVCSSAYDGVLAFSCEMYVKDGKSFVSVLPEMLYALNSSVEGFQDAYDEISKTYKPFSTSNVSVFDVNDNEYNYPKVAQKGKSKLYIEKVTLDPRYTILDMVSYNGREYQWCSISKNSYISVNGTRYPLMRAEGIEYSPQHTYYPRWESGKEVALHFKLFFRAIPEETTSFNFSEGTIEGWTLKGVELQHGNICAVNGECIETTHHKWECISIEVQEGQTVLTKIVTPKSEGTLMYSSQDEYIEDAETGRKYYLQNSSIGFEGSPQISHDMKTITFYEVYPALPLNVKKINISTGSQYYVKDLKIR